MPTMITGAFEVTIEGDHGNGTKLVELTARPKRSREGDELSQAGQETKIRLPIVNGAMADACIMGRKCRVSFVFYD